MKRIAIFDLDSGTYVSALACDRHAAEVDHDYAYDDEGQCVFCQSAAKRDGEWSWDDLKIVSPLGRKEVKE